MTRPEPPAPPAAAGAARIARAISARRAALGEPVAPRVALAEAVAACALHLTQQNAAWQSINAAAIAADNSPDAATELLRELAILRADPQAVLSALTAWELLDAAVRAWAPEAHPIGAVASGAFRHR